MFGSSKQPHFHSGISLKEAMSAAKALRVVELLLVDFSLLDRIRLYNVRGSVGDLIFTGLHLF